jgi:hypothetical protein
MSINRIVAAGLMACVLALVPPAQAAWGRGSTASAATREEVKEKIQQVLDMRDAVRQFYQAKAAGDRAAATEAANKASGLWKNLPENIRSGSRQNTLAQARGWEP